MRKATKTGDPAPSNIVRNPTKKRGRPKKETSAHKAMAGLCGARNGADMLSAVLHGMPKDLQAELLPLADRKEVSVTVLAYVARFPPDQQHPLLGQNGQRKKRNRNREGRTADRTDEGALDGRGEHDGRGGRRRGGGKRRIPQNRCLIRGIGAEGKKGSMRQVEHAAGRKNQGQPYRRQRIFYARQQPDYRDLKRRLHGADRFGYAGGAGISRADPRAKPAGMSSAELTANIRSMGTPATATSDGIRRVREGRRPTAAYCPC